MSFGQEKKYHHQPTKLDSFMDRQGIMEDLFITISRPLIKKTQGKNRRICSE